MSGLRARWEALVRWCHRPERPDTLALVRITFGLAVVANLVQQWASPGLLALYARPEDGGVFPVTRTVWYDLLHHLPATPATIEGMALAQLVAAVLLTVGLFTRPAALVVFLVQLSFTRQLGLFSQGGDVVFRVFAFLMVVAPVGAGFSLDAAWRGRGREVVPAWPRLLLLAQLTILYVRTGVVKAGSSWSFADGWSALYYALNLPGLSRFPGEWTAWMGPLGPLASFTVKWWEILFFVVPLSLWWRDRPVGRSRLRRWLQRDWRAPWLLLGVVFHLSLAVLMDLGLFPFVMLSLYPCALRPVEARRVLSRLLGPPG